MKLLILFATLLLLLGSSVQADPLVSISPAKKEVTIGDSFSVDIVMTGFHSSEGGGLNLQFRPSVIKVNKVSVNISTWSFASKEGDIDNSRGQVSGILFSTFPGAKGEGVIATVELQAIGTGRTGLQLLESSLNPFASRGQTLVVTFRKGKIISRSQSREKKKQRKK